MENCLVTKLKSVVNNDNLKNLGAIKFKAKASGSNNKINFYSCDGTVSIECVDGTKCMYWQNKDPGIEGRSSGYYSITNLNVTFTNTEEKEFIIKNKYGIAGITLNIDLTKLDIEDFSFINGSKRFEIVGTMIKSGVVGDFNKTVNSFTSSPMYLQIIECPNVTTSLSGFNSLPNVINAFSLYHNKVIDANIKNFVTMLRKDRANGSITFKQTYFIVDENTEGTSLSNGVLTWTENSFTITNTNIGDITVNE